MSYLVMDGYLGAQFGAGGGGAVFAIDDATNSNVTTVLTLTHTTTGTPAANIGVQLLFQAEVTDGTESIAAIDAVANDVGSGTEESTIYLLVRQGGGGITRRYTFNAAGLTIAGATFTSGAPQALIVTPGAHTTLTASTEMQEVLFDIGRTVQWAAGNITAQRFCVFEQPTIAIAGAGGTVTDAATAYIAGAPVAGTGATLSATWALWIDAGDFRNDGVIVNSSGSASVPSSTYLGDLDTGHYRSAADVLGMSVGGSGVLLLNGNVNGVNTFTFASQNQTSGANPRLAVFTSGTHTGATGEAAQLLFDLTSTLTFTGSLTNQRFYRVVPGTIAISGGGGTITNAIGFTIEAAPSAGTGATLTNTYAAQIGGASSIGATSAGMTYGAIDVPAHTITVTGSTQVTSVGFAGIRIGQVTVSDASAVTVDTAASLYIANAPVGGGAGPAAITNAYAIWADAGNFRLDGVMLNSLGSASAPSYSINGDANTGMFSPGADLFAVAAGGAEIMRWQKASTGGGWAIMDEADSDPTTTELDAGDSIAIYNKNNKFIVAYNLGGTINYLSIDLDGSDVTWTNSSVAP